MTPETAFCDKCGAVVGETWDACGACGAPRSAGSSPVGNSDAQGSPPAPTDFWSRWLKSVGIDSGNPIVANYLYAIGGICVLIAVIYFLATAGFPPSTTTTFEVGPDGSMHESTSPDMLEVLVQLALFVVGGVLIRAGKAASAESRR
jgi:hypothetical protein